MDNTVVTRQFFDSYVRAKIPNDENFQIKKKKRQSQEGAAPQGGGGDIRNRFHISTFDSPAIYAKILFLTCDSSKTFAIKLRDERQRTLGSSIRFSLQWFLSTCLTVMKKIYKIDAIDKIDALERDNKCDLIIHFNILSLFAGIAMLM